MRGDFLMSKLSTITSTLGGSLTLETTDKINVCQYNCDCDFGINTTFSVIAITPGVDITWSGSTVKPPKNLTSGHHYELCY